MKVWITVRFILIALLFVCLAMSIGMNGLTGSIIFLSIVAAAGMSLMLVQHYIERRRYNALLEQQKEKLLQSLNLQRHDWMNDLQIILGYTQLNKFEKLKVSLEKIKNKLNEDSKIAKLGHPSISLFLFDLRHRRRNLALNIEVDDEWQSGSRVPYNTLQMIISRVMDQIEQAVIDTIGMDNGVVLYLSNNQAVVTLEFDILARYDEAELKRQLEPLEKEWSADIHSMDIHSAGLEQQAYITISVPLST